MRSKFSLIAASAGVLALALPPLAHAQQGPTLEVTLGFIRDKLVAQGPVGYAATITDTTTGQSWVNQFVATISNFAINPAGCALSFHWKATRDGTTIQEIDAGVVFAQVTDVQVEGRDLELQQLAAAGGHPTWTVQTTPQVSAIHIVRTDGQYNAFYFADASLADRVAKAFAHAAQLCGGLKPEAF